ncbi:MAG: helix-hairpin-helix domain-containing protein [Candidatus Marinimicrobia bacterium]|nr:helix-hairpin-helix domain-containing protein [Candidatus Neomarinimicrobiota bacterium]
MDFSNLWWRAKKRPIQPPAPAPSAPPPPAQRPAAPTAPPPAHEADPSSPPPELSQNLDEVISLFDSIREVMGEEEQEALAELPFRAILAHVPEAQRGPAWNRHAIPAGSFAVERKELLRQLAEGRIQVALGDVAAVIPHGWLQGDPETLLEVNLPEVIAVIPPEWIRATTEISEELSAVAGMRDYFGPAETEEPPAPVEQPTPAAPEVPVPPPPAPAAPAAVQPVSVPAPVPQPEPEPPAPPPAERPVPPPEPVAPPVPVAPVAPPAREAEPEPPPVSVPAPDVPEPQPALPPTPEPEAPAVAPSPAPIRIPVPPAAKARRAPRPARTVTRVAPSAAKPLEGPLWDGVETQPDAGAAALDLNVATLKELLELPEIGQHRAMLILAERERRGRFDSIYDLLEIPGIGAHVFVQITGLAPAPRQDRHLVLNRLLDLPPEARPPLGHWSN